MLPMLRKIWPYLHAYRWQVVWALAQVFLIAGFELLKPWPLQIVIDYVLGGKTPPEAGEREASLNSLVKWRRSEIRFVQPLTKEEGEPRRFMGASRESLRASLRLYSWQTLYSGVVNLTIAAGTALVVYVGALSV